ncbi:MAG: DUF2804 domain-containing protein [Deltaproteobacteria bacterium]|jgi:hypothetical protein|nr:DUF2804 domain-containing protein [Deltaproteobacteria bacterium]MBW2535890.1 DUF2804 domain-containing protein [Deltaproteobacteria bacterium]
MRTLQKPPRELVAGGRLQLGTYDGPFERTNALDAEIRAPLPWPRPLKRLRLKEWQAFQFGSPRIFGMVALFNAKVLALVQVKLYDRDQGRKILYERKVAPWTLPLSTTLLDSVVQYERRGCRVAIHNRLGEGRAEIELDIGGGLRRPALRGRFAAFADRAEPMVVCQPFGKGRGMYSHKGLMPAEGELRIGRESIPMPSDVSHALIDDHKGYYPYVMRWDWVTAAGRDRAGRLVGLNLTRNQCIEPERYNENGFWIDGRLHLLPPVRFTREKTRRRVSLRPGGAERWQVRDDAGQVDLRFDVVVGGRVDVNAVVIRSKYRGPFGTFRGRLRAQDGTALEVDDLFGMGEDFYLRC